MEPFTDLRQLELHDATLEALTLEWEARCCRVRVRGALRAGATGADLEWRALESALIPFSRPWGPSASILDAHTLPDGTDVIMLQSGDLLRLRGRSRTVEWRPAAS